MKVQDYFDITGWVTPEEPDMVQGWLDSYPEFRRVVTEAYGDGSWGKFIMVYNHEQALGKEADTMLTVLANAGTQFSSSGSAQYICGSYGNGWFTAGEGCPLASALTELFAGKEFMW